MASRCAISASEARYRRIGPKVAKLHPQQLAKRAALTEPAPGGALGARLCHARDDRADSRGAHRRAHSELLEQRAKPELLDGPQSHVLDADRARANQLQGIDFDMLDVASPGSPTRRGCRHARGRAVGRRCAGRAIPAPAGIGGKGS